MLIFNVAMAGKLLHADFVIAHNLSPFHLCRAAAPPHPPTLLNTPLLLQISEVLPLVMADTEEEARKIAEKAASGDLDDEDDAEYEGETRDGAPGSDNVETGVGVNGEEEPFSGEVENVAGGGETADVDGEADGEANPEGEGFEDEEFNEGMQE